MAAMRAGLGVRIHIMLRGQIARTVGGETLRLQLEIKTR